MDEKRWLVVFRTAAAVLPTYVFQHVSSLAKIFLTLSILDNWLIFFHFWRFDVWCIGWRQRVDEKRWLVVFRTAAAARRALEGSCAFTFAPTHPKSRALNYEHSTRNLESETLNPKPETRNPKP